MAETAKTDTLKAYRAQFDALPATGEPGWLTTSRRAAMGRFEALGLPHRKIEDWKYTNVGPLRRSPFRMAGAGSAADSGAGLDGALIAGLEGPRVVFTNGRFDGVRSRLDELPAGVTLLPLGEALEKKGGLVRSILNEERDDDSLRALNTALLHDGFLLHVAAGVDAGAPVTVVHLTTDDFADRAAQLRQIVVLDDNARASVVEIFAGAGGVAYWTNPVRDVRCGVAARLETVTLIDEGSKAVHTGHSDIRLETSSRFDQVSLLIGGETVRHELRVRVVGEGVEADLSGAYLGARGQSFTVFTELDHRVPLGRSSQLFRGVLGAGAHSAFQGRVVVREGAQKTDAAQSNHNLLLDRSAEADTKPELEIYADDVKCSHGATVGELDGDMLFYLESRGIDPATARAILVEAFVGEIIENIENLPVRDKVIGLVSQWMKQQGAALS